MSYTISRYAKAAMITAVVAIFIFAANAHSQRRQNGLVREGRDVTILVTVHADDDRSRALADKLKPDDFSQ